MRGRGVAGSRGFAGGWCISRGRSLVRGRLFEIFQLRGIETDKDGCDHDGENQSKGADIAESDKEAHSYEGQQVTDKVDRKTVLFVITHLYCAIEAKGGCDDGKQHDGKTVFQLPVGGLYHVGTGHAFDPIGHLLHFVLRLDCFIIIGGGCKKAVKAANNPESATDKREDCQDIQHGRELLGLFQKIRGIRCLVDVCHSRVVFNPSNVRTIFSNGKGRVI
jgi:hypothetical protein